MYTSSKSVSTRPAPAGVRECQQRPVRKPRAAAFSGPRRVALRSTSISQDVSSADAAKLYQGLDDACKGFQKASAIEKLDFSADVKAAMEALHTNGAAKKWGSGAEKLIPRRNVFVGELRQMGIKAPDQLAVPSVRNDATFLWTVAGTTGILAVAAGQLPGDWGFFSSYLIGSITLVVMGIGSTAPGLLQFAIDKFSQVFPDYRERVVMHEAAHFLVGYLLGMPVAGYSLMIGKEHTEFAEGALQRRLFEGKLNDGQVDTFAVLSVAGIAAEGMKYEEVMGQTADLMDLQRVMLRSESRMSDAQQQNVTRWAVFAAAALLRSHKAEMDALCAAMAAGAGVVDCVKAIEGAAETKPAQAA